jgi:dCTP diphosphatase
MAEPLTGRAPIADLDALRARLRQFVAARDWAQFHSPKNLAMALVVEAGELMEPFQWLDGEESAALPADRLAAVRLEMADVLLYLVRLADVLGVDLLAAAADKIEVNEARYPADRVRGRAVKYDEL